MTIFQEIVQKEPAWLQQHRANSFQKLSTSPLPSFRYGLSIVIKPDFDFSIEPAPCTARFSLHCKDRNKIIVERIPADPQKAKQFFGGAWEETHKIYHMHQAYANNLLFITIPKNTELSSPIEITYEANGSPLLASLFVLAEQNSKTTIMLYKSGKASYVSEDIRIITQESSSVEFVSMQNLDKETVAVQLRRAMTKENAVMRWTDLCLGSAYTKGSVITELQGPGASAKNTVLYLAAGKQRFDIYTASIHAAPQTVSNIITKGVVYDQAKALSRGLVKIESNAAGSDGYEKQDVLLLSDEAEADAIPNLEIHNHDVKCSHGSTIGQIDAEQLFYLMSRGLSEDEAKQKIVEGYFNPVLETFSTDLKQKVYTSLMQALHHD